MSKINQMIQELQLKQKKIDYLVYIKDLLKGDQKCVDFVEVQDEVLNNLIPQIDAQISSIENGVSQDQSDPVKSKLTNDQIEVLALIAEKAKGKISAEPTVGKTNSLGQEINAVKKPVVSNQDKMSFAMDNRHLANKNVQVANDQNMIIRGKVVGLDAPFVVVKTEAGPTIQVPLEKVSPV